MNYVDVTTQAELDKAIEKGDLPRLRGTGRFEIRDRTRIEAYDTVHVVLRDSSTATLWNSSTATLYDSSTATLCDSSTATLRDSSTATLWNSSTATLWGSSTATLCDSSKVASAGKWTAIHKLSKDATIVSDGIVIERPNIAKGSTWCEYAGLPIERGIVTAYKAVDDEFKSERGWRYAPGDRPEAPDFAREAVCGGGLHLSPTPTHAKRYFAQATRFVACEVRVSELVPLLDSEGGSDKCKVRRVLKCVEVDINGKPVAA